MKKEYVKPELELITFLSEDFVMAPIDASLGAGDLEDGEEWN